MYLYIEIIGIILIICILFITLWILRSKRIIQTIDNMSYVKKCCMLENLVYPFGYTYEPDQDIFSSAMDAWQKDFGYTAFYDKAASHFQMIFHYLPVYFNYQNHTWLIEFWKGQYGIHTGAEIGLYKSDRILEPSEYDTEVFSAVTKDEMLPLSIELLERERLLVHLNKCHWWLTAFCPGHYANPQDLIVNASLTFPNQEMLSAFVDALEETICPDCRIFVCGLNISFSFIDDSVLHHPFALWQNKLLCRLFLWYTKPFSSSLDRVLYLFESLPFIFHRLLQIRKFKKRKFFL